MSEEKKGKLMLCATPIGNLEDISFRVLRCLKEADVIAAEDTRNTIKLLNHFDIKTSMTSYHEYNKVEKAAVLVKDMLVGKTVALVTDAGTPAISDPGEEIVRQCIEAGVEVTSLPGPAACITALTLSGLPARRFCFEAFLPPEKKERRRILEELSRETRTIILYEAPHHLTGTLKELRDALGPERRIAVIKELTKIHETRHYMKLGDAVKFFEENTPRGEYVLVIEGKPLSEIEAEDRSRWESLRVEEHVRMYMDEGMDKKDAMKAVAKDRGVSKSVIYRELLED